MDQKMQLKIRQSLHDFFSKLFGKYFQREKFLKSY